MKKCIKNVWMLAAIAAMLFVVSCSEKDKTILVTKIELDKTSLSLDPGGVEQITIKVLPEDATVKTYVCSSENEAVAKISASGLVTAIATGNTKVWVKTPDGAVTASANVEVKAVDYAKGAAGNYDGKLGITTGKTPYNINMPLTLTYVSVNKASFAAKVKIPAAAINEQLAPLGLPDVEVGITSENINVTTDDAGGYLITGNGNISFPKEFADMIGLAMAGSTFVIKREDNKPNDKFPSIDKDGNIYLRFEILGLGEVFYTGKKK